MKKTDPDSERPPRDILERTFQFAVRVIQLCGKLDERPGVGRVMMNQILRASTSVPANVEEAQAAQSKADFIGKMSVALKEARETHLRLRLLATANLIPEHGLIAKINFQIGACRQTHPHPLPGGEQASARSKAVPLLGGVRGGFFPEIHFGNRSRLLPLIHEAGEIKRVISAISVSTKRGGIG